MAINYSTGVKTAELEGGLKAAFPSGSVLEFRTGARPSTANSAATGTVLLTITLPGTPWGTAAAGALAKAGTWQGTGSATGTAAHARLRTSGDTGTSSTTLPRLDFTVTATGGGGDIELDNPALAVGQVLTLNTLNITEG